MASMVWIPHPARREALHPDAAELRHGARGMLSIVCIYYIIYIYIHTHTYIYIYI